MPSLTLASSVKTWRFLPPVLTFISELHGVDSIRAVVRVIVILKFHFPYLFVRPFFSSSTLRRKRSLGRYGSRRTLCSSSRVFTRAPSTPSVYGVAPTVEWAHYRQPALWLFRVLQLLVIRLQFLVFSTLFFWSYNWLLNLICLFFDWFVYFFTSPIQLWPFYRQCVLFTMYTYIYIYVCLCLLSSV